METGQEIFCDTNIWYDITDGKLQVPAAILGHARTVMYELLQIKPTMEDPSRQRKICRAYIDHLGTGYHLQPVTHMADVLGFEIPNELVSKSLAEYHKMIEIIRAIAHGPLGVGETEALKMLVPALQEPTRKMKQLFMQMIAEHKKEVDRIDEITHLQETKVQIAKWVSAKIGTHVPPEMVNWGQIELFLMVFDGWLRDFAQQNRKPKFNDFVDVFNLAYVQPGTLYWTGDKYWKRLIKSVNLQDYLYLPSTNALNTV